MKKIKTINKLLSSLTLLSPLAGIGFNNQYQNTQNVITENCFSFNNYVNSNSESIPMGDITVTVEGTVITGYVEGEGTLEVASNITEIAANSFSNNKQITSLNLSNATNLTIVKDHAFYNCSNLTGDLIILSTITKIDSGAFSSCANLASLDLSNATSLTTIGEGAFNSCPLTGDLVIPSKVTSIERGAFQYTKITSLDLSNATSLTTIEDYVFRNCSNLSGDLVIPSNITSIGIGAFKNNQNIASLDLSNATSLTTIGQEAFAHCSNLTGDLEILSNVKNINLFAFNGCSFNNLCFFSETPPLFDENWQPTISEKIYVPSEQAKQAYLAEPNFGFNEDQIEIGLPPEPSPKKSNTGLILGLVFGLGIPIVLATVGFGIWYFTKKKKNNS